MPAPKHQTQLILAGLLLGVFAMVATAQAEDLEPTESKSENVTTNQAPLSVDVRQNVEDSFTPYRYAFVTAGQERYTFLVPDGFRVDGSDPAKVKLISPDYSCVITLGLAGAALPAGAKVSIETIRARIMAGHPSATVTTEHTICADGQTAPALDFVWTGDAGLNRNSRTALVPTAGGLVEFNVTTSPDRFQASLAHFNLVLLTFCRGSDGKFEYVKGSRDT
jgi:hypothetical protein